MLLAFPTEEDHPAHGRHLPPLMLRDEAQGLQVATGERAHGGERLGSGSEVEGFRVQPRHRLLVEALTPREAAQLLDQLGVGAAVRRAHPDVDAGSRPFTDQVMRTARTGVDLQGQHLLPAPRQDLDLRNEARADAVAEHVRQPLLQVKHVGHAADVVAVILHTDEQCAARRVGERDDRPERPIRRG